MDYEFCVAILISFAGMTAAQSRLAETLGAFYNAADRTSEGAMAAHSYKQSVDDLDAGIGRELVRPWPLASHHSVVMPHLTI